MDTPQTIHGVEVTLVDANHCPGAVQLLFRLPTGERYVHCGDMRFCTRLLADPHLGRFRGANAVFLDTTYCNPRFTFPLQEEAIEYVASTIERLMKESAAGGPSRAFLIATYVIGKERILVEVARRCRCKILVTERKLGVMRCLDLPGLDPAQMFTLDQSESRVNVVTMDFMGETWPYFRPNFVNMEQIRTELGVDEVHGVVPTGWMYEMKRKAYPVRSKEACHIHLVPYSEHSSYNELREYVRFLKPHKVIPTVGVHDDDSGKKSHALLKHFRNLVDETASKARFLSTFRRRGSENSNAADSAPGNGAPLTSIQEYDPVKMACWQAGQPTPYLHIANGLQAMERTTKRLRIGDAIANIFRSILALAPEDLLQAAYLVIGKLVPDYEGLELNVGPSIVAAAVAEATGITRAKLRDMHNQLGDMGDVAQACRHTQMTLHRPAPLTVRGVYRTLRQIASEKGSGSSNRRQRAILGMLRSCRESETKFLVRTLVQNLRVGANWRSVIGALARAVVVHQEGLALPKARLDAAAAAASNAFHLCPSLDILVPALVEGGVDELERRCTLTPGVPLKPMLAKISEGIPDVLKQLKGEAFLAEYKYDGQRAQIHMLPDRSVRIFSRNCDDKTTAFPDVCEAITAAAAAECQGLVLDAELVAVDRANGNRLRAFQELSTRARGEVTTHQVLIQVCVFVFDLLYLDGQPLVAQCLRERRARIATALPHLRPGYVELATSVEICPRPALLGLADGVVAAGTGTSPRAASRPELPSTAAPVQQGAQQAAADADVKAAQVEAKVEAKVEERLQEVLLEAFAGGTEGLMLKCLDVGAAYQPSKRSDSWIKLKRDYCEGLRDSLDLVPIGAWYGNGRKAGWFSPFLLAAWDPDTEEFQSVCRCMSGFTDAFYTEATARMKARQLAGPKPYYRTDECPDVWFEAAEVWEIRGADLTLSPVHKAAVGHLHPERGVSLRFPRCIRIREDKRPEDASGPDVICELYHKQTRKMTNAAESLGKAKAATAAGPSLAGKEPVAEGSSEEDDDGGHVEGDVARE
ncbi:hypothetical protein WJX72_004715 [[Myrmecia] bisecta]|uniref:DNA ligase n=1 Tax=[Myrmecia] bisecta TaxID=41462 RepID=A0AAW1R6Z5_9CHLO